jgi:GDPmannose 4,6-dehydratase
MATKALITGITGQDGSYLADLLIGKGYEVHGLVRQLEAADTSLIDHLAPGAVTLHDGDLADLESVAALVDGLRPDEIYNLGGQSSVRISFEQPALTTTSSGLGALAVLEAVRLTHPEARVYQASSSEMFGDIAPPYAEDALFSPRSPYGVAKLYAYWMTRTYREGYGLFASNGILFNHESPRRGSVFVTRKITAAVARIRAGLQDHVTLGNLEVVRDWGYAPEYVEGMWRMLQQDVPGDYVLATGQATSLHSFMEAAFAHAGLDWHDHVRRDPANLRPTDLTALWGDPSKAARELGWSAEVLSKQLAQIMVDADIARLEAGDGTWIDRPLG